MTMTLPSLVGVCESDGDEDGDDDSDVDEDRVMVFNVVGILPIVACEETLTGARDTTGVSFLLSFILDAKLDSAAVDDVEDSSVDEDVVNSLTPGT